MSFVMELYWSPHDYDVICENRAVWNCHQWFLSVPSTPIPHYVFFSWPMLARPCWVAGKIPSVPRQLLKSNQNCMHPLVSLILWILCLSGLLCLVSILSDVFKTASLLLTSNLTNYGARLENYFCLYHLQAKCQPSKLIDYFFQSSSGILGSWILLPGSVMRFWPCSSLSSQF